MINSPLEGLPERPPSEVEWEELLVRLEVVPRALRLAVEDGGGDSPEMRRKLAPVVGREAWFGERLRDMREGRGFSASVGFGPVEVDGREATTAEMVALFARLREQNFAQVQRRGLSVWDWKSPTGTGSITAYQALQLLARMDGETLAALRSGGRG